MGTDSDVFAHVMYPGAKTSDTSRAQKRQNPCPSSLRASDMFAGVQQKFQMPIRYDTSNISKEYCIEVSNKFEALNATTEEMN